MYILGSINLRMVLGHTDMHFYLNFIAMVYMEENIKISKKCKTSKTFQNASANLPSSISKWVVL